MADKRITELSAVSSINFDNDLLPIVNEGFTKKITIRAFNEALETISYQGTDLKDLSANWQSTYGIVSANSESWQNAYTAVAPNSANWTSAYSTVQENSATNWSYQGTDLKDLSANWENTYTTVSMKSADWDAATFNQELTYTEQLTGLNACLRITVNGSTRYLRLFEIGPEIFEFGTEDALDVVITEASETIFFD
jgi:hypothetical protein